MTQLSIIFLGTGGSWPTVKRNVSSVAIKRGGEVIVFDCGEGTQRQFQKSALSYMQISKIFISHFHGDHFLGLPGLIQTMQLNDREKPLHIYGPMGINQLTSELLSLGYFRPNYNIVAHELCDGDTVKFEGYSIKTLQVKHNNIPTLAYALEEDMRPGKFNKPKALALRVPEGHLFSTLQKGQTVTLKNGTTITPAMVLGKPRKGRKIVISGDTVPCESLIAFAKEADVLIHDATFDASLEELAHEYGHTTAQQAATIAKEAKVDQLFLTHISPRYLDYHVLEDEARKIFKYSYVAKDFQEFIVPLKK
ncbi:MAG: ribonuclease Z [Candidatus Thermoplasmatota archaeon]|nr:ribonuclease Z [Candidatus Thermoplasmatota archaeon]